MANLTAVPTKEGLEILNSELKSSVTNFVLIGAETHNLSVLDDILAQDSITYEDIEPYVFFNDVVESSYYDEDGVLTFVLIIPVEEDLGSYTYGVGVITNDNKLVSLTATPKIVPIKGIGGSFIVKVAVKGTAGEVVFKSSDYITPVEANELFLQPLIANTNLNIVLQNKLIEKGIILNG